MDLLMDLRPTHGDENADGGTGFPARLSSLCGFEMQHRQECLCYRLQRSQAGSHLTLWSDITARVSGGASVRKYDHGPGIQG